MVSVNLGLELEMSSFGHEAVYLLVESVLGGSFC